MSEKKKPRSARAAKASGAGGPMDVSLLQKLVDLMATNDLNTVDVRDGDRRIILKRGTVAAAPAMMAVPQAAPALPASPAAARAAEPAGASEDAGLVPIKSPMVGTFYAAPSPDAKPFVSVGSTVDEETDVCIIEAMKVFNNIKAECRGTIARIVVQNGQPVEFGQALFLVKPS